MDSNINNLYNNFLIDTNPVKYINKLDTIIKQYDITYNNDTDMRSFICMCLFEKSMSEKFEPETSNKCKFNDSKVKDYIEKSYMINNELGNLVSEVIENTIYASYSNLYDRINMAVNSFIKQIGKQEYIIVSDSKPESNYHYGLEQWIIQLV